MNQNTPILVGSAQYVDRASPQPGKSLSPADMAAHVAADAIEDAGAAGDLKALVDVLAVARLFEHSVKDTVMWPNPYGNTNNMPRSVARRLDIAPRRHIYAEVGGETPQRLVNQMAEAIYQGEYRAVVLTGAEALATIKNGRRLGLEFDWNEEVEGDFEDLWPEDPMTNSYESSHGITFPIQVYALFEQARRHRYQQDLAACRAGIGTLFEHFSAVAANNPYAQFPTPRSAVELATPSDQNFPLCEPYAKWMVAQDAVNQAAAVVMTSVGVAEALEIPRHHWTYLNAYADVDERFVSERPDLSTSPAQGLALKRVLEDAEVGIGDVDLIDLYSCFPIAVSSACEHLGLPLDGSRPLTLTGGLPFFGGPGNNYSLHAIAEAVQQLRPRSEGHALIAANGGYLSKHSIGLYGCELKGAWQPRSSANEKREAKQASGINVIEQGSGEATIESYAAVYSRGEPAGGYIVARLSSPDDRCLAVADPDDAAASALLFEAEPFGRPVTVSHRDGINYFTP